MLRVDLPLCIGCTLCTLVCPFGAIQNGVLNQAVCVVCGECVKNCPERAIKAE